MLQLLIYEGPASAAKRLVASVEVLLPEPAPAETAAGVSAKMARVKRTDIVVVERTNATNGSTRIEQV